MGFITEQDVRDYVEDGSAKGDLAFDGMELTSEGIASAMKFAAREFNTVNPPVVSYDAAHLPDDTTIFFDAVAMHLLLREKQRLTKEDVDYTAGGVNANLVSKRIAHIDKMIPFYSDRFQKSAKEQKIFINLQRAYGPVG